MKRFLAYIAAALVLVSCVYDFNPGDIGESVTRLVVDGDMVIGELSEIKVSVVYPVNATNPEIAAMRAQAMAWIEGEDGTIYEQNESSWGSVLTIDTHGADMSVRYRLHVKLKTPEAHYVSTWEEIAPSPKDVELYHKYDDKNISMCAFMRNVSQVKWDFRETWEFHADYIAEYGFDEESETTYGLDKFDKTYYYCWNSDISHGLHIASASGMSAPLFNELVLHEIPRDSYRAQIMYRFDVGIYGISSQEYDYLENMQAMSDMSGDLFSPTPSDMPGNMTNLDNPDEFVIGYVGAVRRISLRYEIQTERDNINLPVRKEGLFLPQLDPLAGITYIDYWGWGYVPVSQILNNGSLVVGWGPKRCVDCVAAGGSKTKPADWPTNHE